MVIEKESSELTEKQRATLKALEELPDDRIDTSDIPEVRDWSNARRGVFYRPVKQQITLRLDVLRGKGWLAGFPAENA